MLDTSMDERRDRCHAPFAAGDPLRAIAALAVVVGHVVGLALLSWLIDHQLTDPATRAAAYGPVGDVATAGGPVGVSIFFVLTGYLLGRPFVRAFVLDEARPSLRRFARNRVLRVVPAYWAVLALVVVLVALPGVEYASAGDVARLFAFSGGLDRALPEWIGQGWTLDVEMRFYAGLGLVGTAAVLVRGALPPTARLAALAALAAALAVWSFAIAERRDSLFALDFASNAGRFAPGILLAALEVTTFSPRRSRRLAIACAAGFVVGLAALVAAAVAHADSDAPLGAGANWLLTAGAGAVVGAPLVWQWAGGPLPRLLDTRLLWWAGSRSYSIYLVHLPVFSGLIAAVPDSGYRVRAALLGLAGVPVALGAAELLHRGVEVPFLRRRAPSQVVGSGPWSSSASGRPSWPTPG